MEHDLGSATRSALTLPQRGPVPTITVMSPTRRGSSNESSWATSAGEEDRGRQHRPR